MAIPARSLPLVAVGIFGFAPGLCREFANLFVFFDAAGWSFIRGTAFLWGTLFTDIAFTVGTAVVAKHPEAVLDAVRAA